MFQKIISEIVLDNLNDFLRLIMFIKRKSSESYTIIFYEDNQLFYTLNNILFIVEGIKIKEKFLLFSIFDEEKIFWKRKFVIHDPLTSRLFMPVELPKKEIFLKEHKIKFVEVKHDKDIFRAAIDLFEPLFFYKNIFYFGLFYLKSIFGEDEGIILYRKTSIELNRDSKYLMLTEDGRFVFKKGIDRVLPFVPIIWLKNEL